MTDWNREAPPPLEEDRGGGAALPANIPSQGVMVQTQFGGALQIRRAALALPRRMDVVKRNIQEMAELVEPVGDQGGDTWEYMFPVKNRRKNTTDWITGPTIKCTNAIARCYGNCGLMASRVDDIGQAWVIYGTFLDYETGFEMTRAFQQRKGQSTMGSDAGRGEDIAFQIGVSKSLRNVVNNALGDIVAYAMQVKERRWREKIKANPKAFVERIKARLEAIRYPLVKVEGWTGHGKIDNWPIETIAQVSKIIAAHAEGVLEDLDSVFAPKGIDIDGGAEAKPNGGGDAQPSERVDRQTGEVTETTGQSAQAGARQATSAAEGPEAGQASSPVSEASEPTSTVAWKGKPYQKPGSARSAALKEIAQAKTAGDLSDLAAPVKLLVDGLRKVRSVEFAAEVDREFLAKCEKLAGSSARPQPEPTSHNPETGEVEPMPGDGSQDADDDREFEEDDAYQDWLIQARERITGAPTLGHLRAYQRQLLQQAQEHGAEAVAEVNKAVGAREEALKGATEGMG